MFFHFSLSFLSFCWSTWLWFFCSCGKWQFAIAAILKHRGLTMKDPSTIQYDLVWSSRIPVLYVCMILQNTCSALCLKFKAFSAERVGFSPEFCKGPCLQEVTNVSLFEIQASFEACISMRWWASTVSVRIYGSAAVGLSLTLVASRVGRIYQSYNCKVCFH